MVGDTPGQDIPQESTKTLEELLSIPYEELSEADQDRLSLLTGEMSQAEYDSKYHPDRALELERSDPEGFFLNVGRWEKIDIPGAVCGNGTQYKIFINRASDPIIRSSNRLTIYLEPGGACWDYESCTGQTGIRGAANPNGIPDNHMSFIDYINPFKSGGSPNGLISPLIWKGNPSASAEPAKWNRVFIPYCTGDVHSGNRVAVYEDPTGAKPPLTYHHVGATNIEKVIEYLAQEFPQPQEMLVTGCSAGGAGSLTNYHFFRKGLSPVASYMLNDSGPIFPAPGTGNQYPLHQKISDVWNVGYMMDKFAQDMPGYDFQSDYGLVPEALAAQYPDDRLAITLFKRDGNYSAYSYARFYDLDESIPAEKEQILQLWAQDVGNMIAQYDSHDNLSYFVPYMRSINESHCTTIINWTGTEIENTGIKVGNFIDDLLDGGTVTSYEEVDNPADANVSDFWLTLVKLVLG
jgi:hypothetical protein